MSRISDFPKELHNAKKILKIQRYEYVTCFCFHIPSQKWSLTLKGQVQHDAFILFSRIQSLTSVAFGAATDTGLVLAVTAAVRLLVILVAVAVFFTGRNASAVLLTLTVLLLVAGGATAGCATLVLDCLDVTTGFGGRT